MCDERKSSNAPNVCHMLVTNSLPHEQVCSQNIKYQVQQYVPFISHFRTICEQTVENSFPLWFDDHPCMVLRLCLIAQLFYSPNRNVFPRISLHDLPCRRTMKILFLPQVSPWLLFLVIFHSSGRNPWFEHTSVLIHNVLANLAATQINMVKEWCCFSHINVFHEFSKSDWCSSVSFQPIWCHPHTQTRIVPFSQLTNKHSQLETFSQPYFNWIFSNCLSHNSPAKGWPYRFRSRGTTGSSILDHDFGHSCRGGRIPMSGHCDLGIFNNFGPSSFLHGNKLILHPLLVLSKPTVWIWYPWLLLLSIVMLMTLVQWIRH